MNRILFLTLLVLTSLAAAIGLRDLRYLAGVARTRPELWDGTAHYERTSLRHTSLGGSMPRPAIFNTITPVTEGVSKSTNSSVQNTNPSPD